MGLYQAATSPRLLSSSFEVAAETCGEIYPRGPRVNPFGEICLLEFWQTEYLTYLLFHPSGMSQCSATEVLFHLFVVGFPPRELMIVWNTDDLQRKWKKEVQGMNAWNGCLVTLIFFNIFYMRPFLSNPGTAFAEIKRCPKEIAEILHGLMVQLIKERKIYDNDRTFNEVTELHAILSRDWNGAQPIWAVSHYLAMDRIDQMAIDQEFEAQKQITALEVIGQVFGQRSTAYRLLQEKEASRSKQQSARRRVFRRVFFPFRQDFPFRPIFPFIQRRFMRSDSSGEFHSQDWSPFSNLAEQDHFYDHKKGVCSCVKD
ncbi:hypothetical protein HDK64DRAFT_264737 [Phyllosticta capitalensis]